MWYLHGWMSLTPHKYIYISRHKYIHPSTKCQVDQLSTILSCECTYTCAEEKNPNQHKIPMHFTAQISTKSKHHKTDSSTQVCTYNSEQNNSKKQYLLTIGGHLTQDLPRGSTFFSHCPAHSKNTHQHYDSTFCQTKIHQFYPWPLTVTHSQHNLQRSTSNVQQAHVHYSNSDKCYFSKSAQDNLHSKCNFLWTVWLIRNHH